MRKLLFKLTYFIPVLTLVAVINYWVDPSQLFGNGRTERQVAAALFTGRNVSNLINYDHRLLQKFFFEELNEPKDIVAIGSSRAMMLSQTQFPDHSFYNASVAGASVEDFIAIYELMREQNALPEFLILEVDPWVFNRENEQTRWKTLRAEYLRGLEQLDVQIDWKTRLTSIDSQKYAALLSLSYLQESLRWLTRPSEFTITDQTVTGLTMKLSDGSRIYDAESIARDIEGIEELVQSGLTMPYALTPFAKMDGNLVSLFERFVISVQADGVHLSILLSPYQPTYYSTLASSPEYQILVEAENYLRMFAEDKGIQISGSYNPEQFGCAASEFYDGLHMRPSCLEKIDLEGLIYN